MHLQGSGHCGSVKFSVEPDSPVPFMRCFCSIRRKTAGAGGFAIDLGATARSMKVRGKRHLGIYRALGPDERGDGMHPSSATRYSCARCGSELWLRDPTWPELVHPHASAIDSALPAHPEHVHCMVGSKAPGPTSRAGPRIRASNAAPTCRSRSGTPARGSAPSRTRCAAATTRPVAAQDGPQPPVIAVPRRQRARQSRVWPQPLALASPDHATAWASSS